MFKATRQKHRENIKYMRRLLAGGEITRAEIAVLADPDHIGDESASRAIAARLAKQWGPLRQAAKSAVADEGFFA